MRRYSAAAQSQQRQRQCSRETAKVIFYENAADIILFKERLHGPIRKLSVLRGQIYQIRAAVGGDDHLGLDWVPRKYSIPRFWMGAVRNAGVLVVGIEQGQVELFRQIKGDETRRFSSGNKACADNCAEPSDKPTALSSLLRNSRMFPGHA